MRPGWPTRALLASTLVLGCSERGFEQMGRQQKELPYAADPWFTDGRAMRLPPEGTIPRERELGTREWMTGRDASGRFVARIPGRLTAEMLDRGRKDFEEACEVCHGVRGDGNSTVAGKMALVRPPSLLARPERRDGFFFAVIGEGHGLMPAYGSRFAPSDRWSIVAYLRALMLSQDAPLADAPPEEQARLAQISEGGRGS